MGYLIPTDAKIRVLNRAQIRNLKVGLLFDRLWASNDANYASIETNDVGGFDESAVASLVNTINAWP